MKPHVYLISESRSARYLILSFVLFFLAACSGQSRKGILEVRIKDHANAIGYFAQANISIETIRISPQVGFRFWRLGWLKLDLTSDHLDLTKLVNNSGATVFKGDVDSGPFEAVDLKIRSVRGILKDGSREVAIDNKVKPVALSFSVNPGELTTIVIDLSLMDMSDHPPATYELQLAGYEVYNNGKLVDKIPPG